jgi:hypothetical protein
LEAKWKETEKGRNGDAARKTQAFILFSMRYAFWILTGPSMGDHLTLPQTSSEGQYD